MAINKSALIRYKVLDSCFSNPGRKYFIEDLLNEINQQLLEIEPNSKGIQRRQLFDDIKFMESAEGWSISLNKNFTGKKKYYRYIDSTFSINNQPLNRSEKEQLKSAIELISRFKGMPRFEWINEFTPKLQQAFTLNKSIKPIIALDNNEYLTGFEYISELFNAILYKKPLKIGYQPFTSTSFLTFIFHPYFLKQYNNRWFLFGMNSELSQLSTLALDRINKFEEIQVDYIENTLIDFEEYFEDIIGVSRAENGVVQKVVLRFSPETLPYIISKPLHGSQKVTKLSDLDTCVTIEVMINFELQSLILSFGDKVKVLKPESLQTLIHQKVIDTVNLYKKD